MFRFYTPWKDQETFGKMGTLALNGLNLNDHWQLDVFGFRFLNTGYRM